GGGGAGGPAGPGPGPRAPAGTPSPARARKGLAGRRRGAPAVPGRPPPGRVSGGRPEAEAGRGRSGARAGQRALGPALGLQDGAELLEGDEPVEVAVRPLEPVLGLGARPGEAQLLQDERELHQVELLVAAEVRAPAND